MSEYTPSAASPESSRDPATVLGELVMWAHIRMGEALTRTVQDPHLVWYRRSDMAGFANPAGGSSAEAANTEGLVWYRLGEDHDFTAKGQDRFDVGVVVTDIHAREPVATYLPGDEQQFWVRRDQGQKPYPQPVNIHTVNAFVAVRRPVLSTIPLVPNLGEKLARYHLQPMRLRAGK